MIGTSSVEQLERAVAAAARGALPPEALERVHAALQHAA
jgi:aryl-alcohol dehydrogenase-like predicted oxidoreductase